MSQGELQTHEVWLATTELLLDQLEGVDVGQISDRDFSQGGELVMNPPSVRSFFAGEAATSLSDSQRLSYNVTGRYLFLCADEDLRGSADQAEASLRLAARVKTLLIGARIALAGGDVSEPATYIGMEPEPVEGVGIAYAVSFEIPGLAQFAGPNANQDGPR